MARRWSYWHILFLILGLIPPSLIFLSPTVLIPSLVNLIDTSTGPNVDAPLPEPTTDELSNMAGLTSDEIINQIEKQNLWNFGEDTTRSFDVIAQIQPEARSTLAALQPPLPKYSQPRSTRLLAERRA